MAKPITKTIYSPYFFTKPYMIPPLTYRLKLANPSLQVKFKLAVLLYLASKIIISKAKIININSAEII
jgi:hypothetical protein